MKVIFLDRQRSRGITISCSSSSEEGGCLFPIRSYVGCMSAIVACIRCCVKCRCGWTRELFEGKKS